VHSSSEAVNVFPQTVELCIDCRMPAGQGEEEVRAEIAAALEGVEGDWDLEFISVICGNASATEDPFHDAIAKVLARHVPDAHVAATHCVGFTDSNWFRVAFPEVVAYGWGPYLVEDGPSVFDRYHNVDERIHVKDLAFQALFAEELVRELLVRGAVVTAGRRAR
jgi:acetylornithine deacetylase/succinyl-diaminopimelate desuccinylase-like protein